MNEITRLTVRTATGVDDYLQRANAVYDEQRKRLLDIEAEHARKRTEVQSGYARRVSELAHEGAEALRRLEAEHTRTMAAERLKLEMLARVRHG